MNTHGIERNYSELTPTERFALGLAAAARGDDSDADRLASAAKRLPVRVPDVHPVATAFLDTAWQERASLLDLVARYFLTVAGADDAYADRRRDREKYERMSGAVKASAYLVVTQVAGWRLYCAGRQLTTAAREKFDTTLPGTDTIAVAARMAKDEAFTADECRAYFRKLTGDEDVRVLTTEGHAELLERIYQDRLAFWQPK